MKTFKQILKELAPTEYKYHLHKHDENGKMSHISSSNDLEGLKDFAREAGHKNPTSDYNISDHQDPSSATVIHGYNAKIDDFVKYTPDKNEEGGWKSHWPIVDRIKTMEPKRKKDYLSAWNKIGRNPKKPNIDEISSSYKIPKQDVTHIHHTLLDKGDDYWPFHE